MGQQQLLLLVLGIVIVGLAVVIGIEQFSEGSRKADVDRLSAVAVRMATGAAAWRQTPGATGGGRGDASFARFGLASLGISNIVQTDADSEVALQPATINGVYRRTTAAAHVAAFDLTYTRMASVYLYGPSETCLVMRTGWADNAGNWTYAPAVVPAAPAGCAW